MRAALAERMGVSARLLEGRESLMLERPPDVLRVSLVRPMDNPAKCGPI